jgi:GNAT superfamily N-acetyltransferase
MSGTLIAEAATFSQLDSDRFGIRVARAHIVPGSLPRVLDYCDEQQIDLLIARCATSDSAGAQEMEKCGFLLMDTLLYYAFDLSKKVIPENAGRFVFRPLQPSDQDQIRLVAGKAFKGYAAHYHSDARLDPQKCDEAYISWAERSAALKDGVDEVFVAECSCSVIGFGTLRMNSPHEAEGVLFAVTPEYQKCGVCRGLMIHSLAWCGSRGAQRMVISTQVTNVAMQKVWCRLGFEPSHSYYTFHKWFPG